MAAAAELPLLPTEVDPKKVSIGQVKIRDNGSKAVPIRYAGKPLRVEASGLTTSFGINRFVDPKKPGDPPKFSMDLTLNGDSSEDGLALLHMLEAMDQRMIDIGLENSVSWFKGQKSKEMMTEFYSPSVKISKDKEGNPKGYPPSLKVALKKRYIKKDKSDKQGVEDTGENVSSFGLEFYNADETPVDKMLPIEGLIPNRSKVSVILECTGVWFMGTNQYGVSWKAVQIRIDSLPSSFACGKPAFRKAAAVIADSADIKSYAAQLTAAAGGAGTGGGYDDYDAGMLSAVMPSAPAPAAAPAKKKKAPEPEPEPAAADPTEADVEIPEIPHIDDAPAAPAKKHKKPKKVAE